MLLVICQFSVMLLVVCQFRRDVIGRLSVQRDVIGRLSVQRDVIGRVTEFVRDITEPFEIKLVFCRTLNSEVNLESI